ncbi:MULTISPECIES: helix-turn-helix domain-containing protein [unclassified Bacillus cereus group]|uniref:helix-turn-helix domain-containing protein n=1 Tax=unclassified Bacillus cereus group TaxID=2750818 RepID=UPI001F56A80B|nr:MULTISPECIES: helix-turn-helix domain-containing protein [unclassified Bacillus cereus group]
MEFLSENLGLLIRDLRQKVGVSQKELCKGICSQAEISKIENGRILPSIYTLIMISYRLGLEPNYFFNQITKKHYDFIYNVKSEIRKCIHKKDYKAVYKIIKKYKSHSAFQSLEEKQFFLWHTGIIEYYLFDDLEKSITSLEGSLKIKQSFKHSIQDINILNSLAVIKSESGNYTEAINTLKIAFKHYYGLNCNSDPKIYSKLCYNISKPFIIQNNDDVALKYCNLGIENCLDNHTSFLLGELYYQKGFIYSKKKEVKQALDFYSKALNLFEIVNKQEFANLTKIKITEINTSSHY